MVKGEAEKAEIDLLEKLNASRADEGPDNQGLLGMPDVEDH